MKLLTRVWVPGNPRTKGSLEVVNAGARGRKPVVQDTEASRRWLMLVVDAVRGDLFRRHGGQYQPARGPIYLHCPFWLAVPARVGDEDIALAGIWHQAGDSDKLMRNVMDALSSPKDPTDPDEVRKRAGLYVDDVQVQSIVAPKYGCGPDQPAPGVALEAYELLPSELVRTRAHAAEWSTMVREGRV